MQRNTSFVIPNGVRNLLCAAPSKNGIPHCARNDKAYAVEVAKKIFAKHTFAKNIFAKSMSAKSMSAKSTKICWQLLDLVLNLDSALLHLVKEHFGGNVALL